MPSKILVVDDDLSNRLILKSLLTSVGYQVIVAENGEQAVAIFERESPDVVLMDIMMPLMDGYEATKRIKELATGRVVPVIFLTAVDDENGLSRCLECGGDDFLKKPYSAIIIKTKVDAMVRLSQLHATVITQREELSAHQERLLKDQDVAKTVFQNIAHAGCLNSPNIKYMLSPMSIFNGDLLLAARKPSSGMNVMLCDFTGHGLSAAIGALPVADIFYRMTAKGFGVEEIIYEINNKLKRVLPTGMFCAACIIEINPAEHKLIVWNAGLPDILVCGSRNGIRHRFPSMHLPFGVVGNERLDTSMCSVEIDEGDGVYMYTDGVIEAWNINGEMFGQKRLEEYLSAGQGGAGRFSVICDSLGKFIGDRAHSDDITFIEIICNEDFVSDVSIPQAINGQFTPPMTWRMTFDLEADVLRNVDPLPLLTHLLVEIQGLRKSRDRLYTIMAELFFNALDHGLLKLDSAMKSTPHGFMEYYDKRNKSLAELQEGKIKIILDHTSVDDGGVLVVRFEDSGSGFDYHKQLPALSENVAASGRGIPLVRSLCQDLSYSGNGNIVEAVYRWYS